MEIQPTAEYFRKTYAELDDQEQEATRLFQEWYERREQADEMMQQCLEVIEQVNTEKDRRLGIIGGLGEAAVQEMMQNER